MEYHGRDNPLINAARGRDACGINHDELRRAAESDSRALAAADRLASVAYQLIDIIPCSRMSHRMCRAIGEVQIARTAYLAERGR